MIAGVSKPHLHSDPAATLMNPKQRLVRGSVQTRWGIVPVIEVKPLKETPMTHSLKAALVATLALGAGAPTIASAQATGGSVASIVNCDAPGGRQATGAVIGGVLGGVIGNQVAKNERTLGTVAGAAAGAAAGSWIGCKQQRDRANAYSSAYQTGYAQASAQGGAYAGGGYVARSNLKVRAAPTTRAAQVGSLRAGQSFQALGNEGSWIRVGMNGQPVGYVSSAYVSRY